MVFWKSAQPAQAAPSVASASMDHSEEMLAEVDEPPDEPKSRPFWSPPKMSGSYMKATPYAFSRRESLLTRQLHSETEHSDEEHHPHPTRALSTQSTWSNQSTTSTAELTSDDGISMPSPMISPPLPPTQIRSALPTMEKPLDRKVNIVGQEDVASGADKEAEPEKAIEATLGRRRCIMFACRGKDESKPKAPSPPPTSVPEKAVEVDQPKRKCMIKFACPSRSGSQTKATETVQPKRAVSPPPMQRKASAVMPEKVHRGSDSTVTHGSPSSVRKSPSITTTAPTPTTAETPKPLSTRKHSNDSEETGTEATRFHEFYSSEDEPEEWVQEVTCHRSRLTVSDTLQKENVIRKACEEVEEEAIEEEEDEEDEETVAADPLDEDADEDEDVDEDQHEDEESEGSDAGFHSDDEEGFAASDSDGESDYEWWRPGGSTAATSIEHLDRLTIQQKADLDPATSSYGSASSGHTSPHTSTRHQHRSPRNRRRTPAMPIGNRTQEPDLPDSTDFVCGTLDEDRPLEQAYLNRKKDIEAAKHKARPQDIDPSFPTSDPDMDEEDDEDLEDPEESENEGLVHGEMEELDNKSTPRRRPSLTSRRTTNAHRSPPPAARYHSPPPSKQASKHHSPPLPTKRGTARSPPPRKLFGHSPKRARSPAPGNMMTSPPNTRRSSPSRGAAFATAAQGLAERPQLTHTASLPRNGVFLLSRMAKKRLDDAEGSDAAGANSSDYPKRGAIDIVKGLEKKRQRRKEKAWQKLCAKNAAKGEKAYKVKPGKGAERMRELGLELQRYHGKGEHILSV